MTSNTLTNKKGSEISGPRKRSMDDVPINIGNKNLILVEKKYSLVFYYCKLCNKEVDDATRWLQHVNCARHKKKKARSTIQEHFNDNIVRIFKLTEGQRSFWRQSDTRYRMPTWISTVLKVERKKCIRKCADNKQISSFTIRTKEGSLVNIIAFELFDSNLSVDLATHIKNLCLLCGIVA